MHDRNDRVYGLPSIGNNDDLFGIEKSLRRRGSREVSFSTLLPESRSSKNFSSNCQGNKRLPLAEGVCTTIDGGQYRRLKPVCPRRKEDVTGVGPVNRVVE